MSLVRDKVDGLLGNDLKMLRQRDAPLFADGELRAKPQGEGPTHELGESESGRLSSVSPTTSCGGRGAARLALQP